MGQTFRRNASITHCNSQLRLQLTALFSDKIFIWILKRLIWVSLLSEKKTFDLLFMCNLIWMAELKVYYSVETKLFTLCFITNVKSVKNNHRFPLYLKPHYENLHDSRMIIISSLQIMTPSLAGERPPLVLLILKTASSHCFRAVFDSKGNIWSASRS